MIDRSSFKRCGNKFTILFAISIILTLVMSSPASSMVMVEYRIPSSVVYAGDARPLNIIANPTDVYFTEQSSGRIGQINRLASPLRLIEYIIPPDLLLGNSQPWGIAQDASNNLWFTDYTLNMIGKIPSGGGHLSTWSIPTGSSGPRGIVPISTTIFFFTEWQAGKIGSLTVSGATGTFNEWQLPDPTSQPNDIIFVKNTVYFTEYAGDRIGAYNLTSFRLKEFMLPGGSKPWSLVADSDGMIWYTCSGRNVIGVLNPSTGAVTEHQSIPTDSSQPRGIDIDTATGNVWFTEYAGNRIGKYVQSENMFYEYPTLTGGSSPNDVAIQRSSGNPGNLTSDTTVDVWFTEYAANRIGRISQGGPIARFGTTSTSAVTTLTSAVSNTFIAGSSTTTTTSSIAATIASIPPSYTTTTATLTGTYTTSAVRGDTAFRLSTSTLGTSTSYIVGIGYTTVTNTSVSTSYIATQSVTSSTTFTSTSISYLATTSVTSTTTSFITINTATVQRTSSSMLILPGTLTTTVVFTNYKSTTPGTTYTTLTQTANIGSTSTTFTTIPTTITKTTSVSKTSTSYSIPPLPKCLIASAAYGSELSPQVQALRSFRDGLVMKTFAGSQFMQAFNAWYYSFSPSVAPVVSKSPSLALVVRAFIYPLLGILQVAAAAYAIFGFNAELGVTIAGLLASSLIGLVYNAPWITAVLIAAKKKRHFEMKLRYLVPFVAAWIVSLVMIGIAGLVLMPLLMMFATAAFILLTLGLSATGVATLIAKKLT